jgi:hypothetical protein
MTPSDLRHIGEILREISRDMTMALMPPARGQSSAENAWYAYCLGIAMMVLRETADKYDDAAKVLGNVEANSKSTPR